MNLPNDPSIEDDGWEWNPNADLTGKFEESPLFSTNYDPEDPTQKALQAIAFEDTPDEVARTAKEAGNEHLKRGPKWYKDGIKSYTSGLEQELTDMKLKSELYSNRSLGYLYIKNYEDCLNDVKQCLIIDPGNPKAIFRGAKSTIEMKKYDECIEFCDKLPDLKEMQELKTKCKIEIEKARKLKEEQDQLANAKKLWIEKCLTLLKSKKIKIGENEFKNTLISYPQWNQQEEMYFRVTFVYNDFLQSDVIEQFWEKNTFFDHLNNMFPPNGPSLPWEHELKDKYTVDNLVISYWDQKKDIFVEVMTTETILSVLQKSNYYLPKSLQPIFHVTCKQSRKL
jgi:tetratricopeptide (TPR) repeat protein